MIPAPAPAAADWPPPALARPAPRPPPLQPARADRHAIERTLPGLAARSAPTLPPGAPRPRHTAGDQGDSAARTSPGISAPGDRPASAMATAGTRETDRANGR